MRCDVAAKARLRPAAFVKSSAGCAQSPIYYFEDGDAGFDVTPLLEQGAAAGELATDSQRYFDIHHTRNDSLDKVNPRELHLGAAALASLIYLVDTQGL